MTSAKDPLEGFHITGYDEETGKLTIEIHPYLLKEKNEGPLAVKSVEIMKHGPGVDRVEFIRRSSSE